MVEGQGGGAGEIGGRVIEVGGGERTAGPGEESESRVTETATTGTVPVVLRVEQCVQ